MENERLSEILRALPGASARPDFTQRVLARLDAPPAPRGLGFAGRWVLAAAACAGIVLGAGALRLYQVPSGDELRRQQAEETLAGIRAEHARLRQELERLAGESEAPDNGVVYLGGNENVDFVVDLQRVTVAPNGVSAASYNPNRTGPSEHF
jgi:hypothetical protein